MAETETKAPQIKTVKDAVDAVAALLNDKRRVVVIGETDHYNNSFRDFRTMTMSTVGRNHQFTGIGLEVPKEYQPLLDKYLKARPEEEKAILEQMQQQAKKNIDGRVKFIENSELHNLMKMVKKSGINLHFIDTNFSPENQMHWVLFHKLRAELIEKQKGVDEVKKAGHAISEKESADMAALHASVRKELDILVEVRRRDNKEIADNIVQIVKDNPEVKLAIFFGDGHMNGLLKPDVAELAKQQGIEIGYVRLGTSPDDSLHIITQDNRPKDPDPKQNHTPDFILSIPKEGPLQQIWKDEQAQGAAMPEQIALSSQFSEKIIPFWTEAMQTTRTLTKEPMLDHMALVRSISANITLANTDSSFLPIPGMANLTKISKT